MVPIPYLSVLKFSSQMFDSTLSGQLWWGMPGCINRLEEVSSIRPWPADTRRRDCTCNSP